MAYDALLHSHFGGRDFPFVSCCLHEHRAGRSAPLAHVFHGGADTAAASRTHVVPHTFACEILAGRRIFGGDFGPVGVEFVGDELRETGKCALPHFLAADANYHCVVGLYDDPSIYLRRCCLRGGVTSEGNMETKRQPCGRRSANKKVATGDIDCVHVLCLPQPVTPAACLIAARMRL